MPRVRRSLKRHKLSLLLFCAPRPRRHAESRDKPSGERGLTWVAIGGGFEAPNIYNLANFVRACPDGSVLTLESSMLNVLPLNMMAIAMGLHVRCGNEDNLWTQRRDGKMSSV